MIFGKISPKIIFFETLERERERERERYIKREMRESMFPSAISRVSLVGSRRAQS